MKYTDLESADLLNVCGSDAAKWAAAFCQYAAEYGHDIDEGWMITWFANAIMRAIDERRWQEESKLSASEAVFGFAAWLTTRRERTVMSTSDDASPIVELIAEFCRVNGLDDPRPDWAKNLTHPKEQ